MGHFPRTTRAIINRDGSTSRIPVAPKQRFQCDPGHSQRALRVYPADGLAEDYAGNRANVRYARSDLRFEVRVPAVWRLHELYHAAVSAHQ
jgi:hypothetical protein